MAPGTWSEALASKWLNNSIEPSTFKKGQLSLSHASKLEDFSESRLAFYSFSNRLEAVTEFSEDLESTYSKVASVENLGGSTNFDVMTDGVIRIFTKSKASHKYVILITNGKGTMGKDKNGSILYDEGTY